MKTQIARIAYEACPLCESKTVSDVGEIPCTDHPLHSPELGDAIAWRSCENCGHVFTDGYFDGEAEQALLAKTNPHQVLGPDEVHTRRRIAAKTVTLLSTLRGTLDGRWLDVGCGNGALLAAAAEFGYAATGIDRRQQVVDPLIELGYDARCTSLEDLEGEGQYDVISMADVLEHTAYPRETLAHARRLLHVDGILFLSMPNRDTLAWKTLDREGKNPYWAEIEHYHNFDRIRMYALLTTSGLAPCWYGVSERYLSGMELCAVKTD